MIRKSEIAILKQLINAYSQLSQIPILKSPFCLLQKSYIDHRIAVYNRCNKDISHLLKFFHFRKVCYQFFRPDIELEYQHREDADMTVGYDVACTYQT